MAKRMHWGRVGELNETSKFNDDYALRLIDVGIFPAYLFLYE